MTVDEIIAASITTTDAAVQSEPDLVADGRALEVRWAEIHAEVAGLDSEWRHLMERLTASRLDSAAGLPAALPWIDGLLLFASLSGHAAHAARIADEARHICLQYAQALQSIGDMLPTVAEEAVPPRTARIRRLE